MDPQFNVKRLLFLAVLNKGLHLQIKIAIYDWDIVWKSTALGSSILEIVEEGQTEAVWHSLDSASGQVSFKLHWHAAYSKGELKSNFFGLKYLCDQSIAD